MSLPTGIAGVQERPQHLKQHRRGHCQSATSRVKPVCWYASSTCTVRVHVQPAHPVQLGRTDKLPRPPCALRLALARPRLGD